AMPEMTPANNPTVSLTAKSSKIKSKVAVNQPPQSALELLSQSRVGNVISVVPVATKIWVQIGAFGSEDRANNVLSKVGSVGSGEVSMVNRLGKRLYRVRLGPLDEVAMADSMLQRVFNIGFSGAQIVVD
ncbi:MAG: SPOR domain-containing protein, partial [Alphaproteobacteria bacterium]|nr:SPOR domain-containing protein [Alphaproteobacteria bacterium]